jgi:hypothetical protein
MIYFIRDTVSGYIKVGFSLCPEYRFKDIQSTSPSELVLVGTVDGDKHGERELHRRYREYRVRGEWFRPGGDLALLDERLPTPSRVVRRKVPVYIPPDPKIATPRLSGEARETAALAALIEVARGDGSYTALAAKIGVSPSFLSSVRYGNAYPSRAMLEALGRQMISIYFWEDY